MLNSAEEKTDTGLSAIIVSAETALVFLPADSAATPMAGVTA